ncbi:MAG: CgeB family protein [Solirubrobacteraceae bacterium]
MKILYAAMRHDYGRPEQGPSFEHQTFYDTLVRLGHEIIYFDFVALSKEHGRAWVNRRLWDIATIEDPDLMFCTLFGEELDKEVVARISNELRTVTVNWFCDDHWRFYDFSRSWTPSFNWVVTTAPASVAPYEQHGLHNVIRSQWACNRFTFHPVEEAEPLYDVAFVGMVHGERQPLIDAVRRAGIDVRAWGSGWPSGRLSVSEMVQVFNRARINLNLSESWLTEDAVAAKSAAESSKDEASAPQEPIDRAGLAARLRAQARRVPGARSAASVARAARRRIHPPPPPAPPAPPRLGRYIKQLKARTFEVPGCGGFLLTQDAPELDRYFDLGTELAVFHETEQLIEQLRYYLDHEQERARIAAAGHARVRRDHTYERRFQEIFEIAGLAS